MTYSKVILNLLIIPEVLNKSYLIDSFKKKMSSHVIEIPDNFIRNQSLLEPYILGLMHNWGFDLDKTVWNIQLIPENKTYCNHKVSDQKNMFINCLNCES